MFRNLYSIPSGKQTWKMLSIRQFTLNTKKPMKNLYYQLQPAQPFKDLNCWSYDGSQDKAGHPRAGMIAICLYHCTTQLSWAVAAWESAYFIFVWYRSTFCSIAPVELPLSSSTRTKTWRRFLLGGADLTVSWFRLETLLIFPSSQK